MSFANTAAFALAALAIPVVVLYILKIRLRRVPVSTILFWDQIFEEKRPRSLWERLRHLASLLVQLAFLALLVLALAEPYFGWERRQARRLVLVLDNSASMNATDVGPSRLDAARREAIKVVDGLRFLDEVAVISAGSEPKVYCGLTGHQRTLRQAIASIPATDGPTRVVDAVALARRLLADKENRRVVVLSDAAFEGSLGMAKEPDVDLVSVGGRAGNVGITRLQARRSLLDPVGYQILAQVENASDQPVECRLELDLDGDVIDVVPLKLEPNGRWSQVFEKTSTEGGRLTASLNHKDALTADDRAWAILPRREVKQVTLVSPGNLFLEKVLEASDTVNATRVDATPASLPAGSITVFHRTVPAKLPPGPVFVVEPTGSCDLWDLGPTLQDPIVAKQDKSSPVMANIRLDNVLLPEARKLTPRPGVRAEPLAVSIEGDPLLCAFDRPEGKVLVLTVNLDKGDLPLQTTFPILFANALSWFTGTKGELRESLATGVVADLELPRGTIIQDKDHPALALKDPAGTSRPATVEAERATVGPLDRCGIWSLGRPRDSAKPAGEFDSVTEFACNLASRAESDLRAPVDLASKPSAALAGYGGWPIWFGLIVTAWGVAGVEWASYQRRWIS